jgi:hypothetical protein
MGCLCLGVVRLASGALCVPSHQQYDVKSARKIGPRAAVSNFRARFLLGAWQGTCCTAGLLSEVWWRRWSAATCLGWKCAGCHVFTLSSFILPL